MSSTMKKIGFKMFVTAALSLGAFHVHAIPITYSFSAVGVNGTLGAQAFSGATISFNLSGDTDNVIPASPGSPSFNTARNYSLTGTFSIDGIASGDILNTLGVYKSNSIVGMRAVPGSDFLYLFSSQPYDLTSDIGPITGNGFRQNNFLNTDFGQLRLSNAGTATFSAGQPQDPTQVPEPASLLLVLGGLAGFAFSTRRPSPKR